MKFWVGSRSVTVNIPDWKTLETTVLDRYDTGKGFFLATLNLDHLAKLRQNKMMQVAYGAQDLVCADGNPIVWMSELAQTPVTLMPGSDLVIPLAKLAAEKGIKVALVGSTTESLRAAGENMQKQVPDLKIAFQAAPALGFDPFGSEAEEIVKGLRASGAKMCFVALGAPKQECFALYGLAHASNVGFVCIGAGLDFLSGSQARAPKLVRRFAMEWAWRLASNPQRFAKRYADCVGILPGHMVRSFTRDQNDEATADFTPPETPKPTDSSNKDD